MRLKTRNGRTDLWLLVTKEQKNCQKCRLIAVGGGWGGAWGCSRWNQHHGQLKCQRLIKTSWKFQLITTCVLLFITFFGHQFDRFWYHLTNQKQSHFSDRQFSPVWKDVTLSNSTAGCQHRGGCSKKAESGLFFAAMQSDIKQNTFIHASTHFC